MSKIERKEVIMKYEVLKETKIYNGRTLHRIKFLKDVDNEKYRVAAGDYGGWIESEDSLPQEGNWTTRDDTIVLATGKVSGNAVALDAVVSGEISENAFVCGGIVKGKITGSARLSFCEVGYCSVVRSSELYDTEVKDHVSVDGAYIQNGYIDSSQSYLTIGPLGNFNPAQIFTFYKGKDGGIHVSGNKFDDERIEDFSAWTEELQGSDKFKAAIEMAKKFVKTED